MEKIDTTHVRTLCLAHEWHQTAPQGVSRSTDQMAQSPVSQQKNPSSFDHSHEKDNQTPGTGYAGAQ